MDQIFNLKFTSKQLVRASRKCEKEEKDEKLKIKKAIEKGGWVGGRVGAAPDRWCWAGCRQGPAQASRPWCIAANIHPPTHSARRLHLLLPGPPHLPPCSPLPCSPPPSARPLSLCPTLAAGNADGAKIYAQNAIRKKNEALNYLRLGSRLDAVVSRLDQQAKMQVGAGARTGGGSLCGARMSLD